MRKAIRTVAASSTVIAVLRRLFVFGRGDSSVMVCVLRVLIAGVAIGRDCCVGSQDWFRVAGGLGAGTLVVGSVSIETSGSEKRTGAVGFAGVDRIGVVRRFMRASCTEKGWDFQKGGKRLGGVGIPEKVDCRKTARENLDRLWGATLRVRAKTRSVHRFITCCCPLRGAVLYVVRSSWAANTSAARRLEGVGCADEVSRKEAKTQRRQGWESNRGLTQRREDAKKTGMGIEPRAHSKTRRRKEDRDGDRTEVSRKEVKTQRRQGRGSNRGLTQRRKDAKKTGTGIEPRFHAKK
jgi:hypothetical protein